MDKPHNENVLNNSVAFSEYLNKMKILYLTEVRETKTFSSKIDKNSIPKGENEIRLFVVVRNESLRLPYFLEYYLKSGVDRFFMIDNNSTDNTREIALRHKNVHVFKICESYKNHWNWVEYFLNEYGKNRWCLVVDADELLHFPFSEKLTIKNLISYLDRNKYTAMRSLLLDVYSDKAIADTYYESNTDPLKVCPFFDPEFSTQTDRFFDKNKWEYFNSESYAGGVRTRVFKQNNATWFFNLTKFSLFKHGENSYLVQGMHGINRANIADIEGAVIHTKFMSDFNIRVYEETLREEHFNNAMEYKIYNSKMQKEKSLSLYHEGSVRYKNTDQLIDLGVMKNSENYQNFVNNL